MPLVPRFRLAAGIALCLVGAGCSKQAANELTCSVPKRAEVVGSFELTEVVTLPRAGTYVVQVGQSRADVQLLVTQDGKRVVLDTPTWRDGTERLIHAVNDRAELSLTLRSTEHPGHKGSVDITVCSDEGQSGGSTRMAAEQLMMDGARWAALSDSESWKLAEAAFAEAEEKYRDLGLGWERAFAAYARGMLVYYPLEENSRAAVLLKSASSAFSRVGDEPFAANALARAGAAGLEAARLSRNEARPDEIAKAFADARQLLSSAAAAQQRLGRRYDHALSINDIAITHQYEGHLEAARQNFAQALKEFEELGELRRQIMVRQNLAASDFETGEFASAMQRYEQIEIEARKNSDAAQLADIAANMAVIYSATDQPDKALAAYAQALEFRKSTNPLSSRVVRAISGMAGVYMRMGHFDRALTRYQEALQIARKLDDRRSLVSTLSSIGDAHRQTGAFAKAEVAHKEALGLARSHFEQARTRLAIALDCSAAGRIRCAREELNAVLALPLPIQHPLRGRAIEESSLLGDTGAPSAGTLKLLADAESIFKRAGSSGDIARVTFRAAKVARDQGQLDLALRLVNRSVEHIEAVRGRTAMPEVRARILADAHAPYELQSELHLAGMPELDASSEGGAPRATPLFGAARAAALRALLASDGPRARFLLELVAATSNRDGQTNPRAGEADRRQLYLTLAGLRYRQDELLEIAELRPDQEALLQEVRFSLERVRFDLDRVEGQLGGAHVETAISQPRLATLESWMRRMPPNRRFVEYFLGERITAVWVLSRDKVTLALLPPRGSLETRIEAVRAMLSEPPVHADEGSWRPAAKDLAELLVQPIASELRGKDVVVVSHRTLAGVPFEVLLSSGNVATTSITHAASASAAMMMDQRPRPPQARNLLAIFADPVFSAADARIARVGADVSENETTQPTLERLPATAREAGHIAQLAPDGRATVFSGLRASLENALDPQLREFRMLHFATHAAPDAFDPQLSSIALSTVDSRGASIEGSLRMYQLRDVSFHADLVVLSACESAVGSLGANEGFAGLTHTFIAAGARQVVASLWRTSDEATEVLMTEMYRSMFKEGATVEAALSSARKRLSAQPRWQHPYFWAPFVVIGHP